MTAGRRKVPDPARRAAFALAANRVRGLARSAAAGGDVVLIGGNPLSKMYLRFHIALLIAWSFCVGALTTKLLLVAGVHSMEIRYAVSLFISYGAFFVGVRLWLAYVGAERLWGGRKASATESGSSGGGGDLLNWGGSSGGGGSGGSAGIRAGGGDFGGGGASSSFGAIEGDSASSLGSPRMQIMPFTSAGSPSDAGTGSSLMSSGGGHGGHGGGGGSFDLDLGDDGWLVVLLCLLVAAVLASAFGVVLYLIWSGPALLADVAFQAMLAGGLVKSTRDWRNASWETRLLSATWIPFTIVLVLAVAMAMVGAHLFPDARTFGDMIHALRGRLG